MTDDPTLDTRFLEEVIRRADTAIIDNINGTEICETIGAPADSADLIVKRLINRGLVERTKAPARLSDGFGDFDIRPTQAAYRLGGHGLRG